MEATLLTEVTRESHFVGWQGHYSKVTLDTTCPKCGAETICMYADFGSADFVDVYEHLCSNPNCDFSLKEESFSAGMTSRDEVGPENCPFCGREV